MIITKREVEWLLDIQECMDAVAYAFKLHAEGKALQPKILGLHVPHGGFHIKAGAMDLGRPYFVAKANANFPDNMKNNGLPTIQGVIIVCDAANGKLLALMDSIAITVIRTGAATGIAAKYLARKDAKVATICGCGNQGRVSLKAMMTVRPIERVYAYDIDQTQKNKFTKELTEALNVQVIPVDDLGLAVRQSDICVTCTTSKKPFLNKEDVKPGTFIAAVGADSEDKQELQTTLLASCKLVVDILEQSATIGELHHALEYGVVTRDHVHAELGEIIAGSKTGRTSDDEVIVFDSTGTALQDVASAAIVYEKAIGAGIGMSVNLANG
ncbi:ornithine cyclodeaminase family protein [Chryseolinea soli]|uniref:ornithine cyclodeaminase family protein n=1 Tax=Chryseolinea soli TaxID=2321403 RepID=UPI0013575D04|nr:ornithine cyclodeaminase family protein [Chryseolinea soli]